MVDGDALIREFNIGDLPQDQQAALVDQYTYELGQALEDGLTDDQIGEFTAIINGDADRIAAWLSANAPGYREDSSFVALQEGYDDDPEKVPAEKVYASIGWVRVNRPDFDDVNARIKDSFRDRIAAARTPR